MTITKACGQPPSTTLLAAVRQFNQGAYFICHETLEELWNDKHDPLRDFYKGVLQIGVGLLHLQRGNLKGARALLLRGSALIDPMAPHCLGIDVNDLLAQATEVVALLDAPDAQRPLTLEGRRPQIKLTTPS